VDLKSEVVNLDPVGSLETWSVRIRILSFDMLLYRYLRYLVYAILVINSGQIRC
jgi:hypothetical protein